jgi:hypothetical protein
MTHRSPATVFILSFMTGGIYSLFWLYWTKQEMQGHGADVPTFLLVFVPIAGIYWLWKWAEGVELVTSREMSGPSAFLLTWLLGPIGMAIVQDRLSATSQPNAAVA